MGFGLCTRDNIFYLPGARAQDHLFLVCLWCFFPERTGPHDGSLFGVHTPYYLFSPGARARDHLFPCRVFLQYCVCLQRVFRATCFSKFVSLLCVFRTPYFAFRNVFFSFCYVCCAMCFRVFVCNVFVRNVINCKLLEHTLQRHCVQILCILILIT